MDLTREWEWGIAILCDPTVRTPPADHDLDQIVTLRDQWLVIQVAAARDSVEQPDGTWLRPAATLHVETRDAPATGAREVLGDVVLETPGRQLSIGDAEDEVVLEAPGVRTRIIVSAEVVDPYGLEEAWIELLPA